LGLSKHQSVDPPIKNSFLSKKDIVDITCGEANYAVAKNGDLYGWGLISSETVKTPTKID
jgi:alpha-tubulin suppressor-like RCC1 family protein